MKSTLVAAIVLMTFGSVVHAEPVQVRVYDPAFGTWGALADLRPATGLIGIYPDTAGVETVVQSGKELAEQQNRLSGKTHQVLVIQTNSGLTLYVVPIDQS